MDVNKIIKAEPIDFESNEGNEEDACKDFSEALQNVKVEITEYDSQEEKEKAVNAVESTETPEPVFVPCNYVKQEDGFVNDVKEGYGISDTNDSDCSESRCTKSTPFEIHKNPSEETTKNRMEDFHSDVNSNNCSEETLNATEECTRSYLWQINMMLMKHGTVQTAALPYMNVYYRNMFPQDDEQKLMHSFSCKICGQTFSSKDESSSHQKTHHKEGPHTCEFCGETFPSKGKLGYHKKTHTELNDHVCEICGKSFSRGHYLVKHRYHHKKDKVYSCNECGKTFFERGYLLIHTKTHTAERPFKCEVCGKCFSTRDYFTKHQKRHSRERSHACESCGKSFFERNKLVNHQRIHTDERPYVCDVCGKMFREGGHLRVHKKCHKSDS